MGATEFTTSSAHAVKRWSNKLAREVFDASDFKKFSGRSENSIVQIHTDLNANAGDEIKYDVLYQNRGPGVPGDSTLEGYEDPLEFYQETLTIDQLRQAHNFRGMSQQRTLHDLREASRRSTAEWYGQKLTSLMYAAAAGVSGDSSESCQATLTAGFTGVTLEAPDSDHYIDKTTGGFNTLNYIDMLVARAKALNPTIRPVMVGGKAHWVLVLHPYQIYTLRITTGDRGWTYIQSQANVRSGDNPIFTGAQGVYNGVVIHESEFIPRAETAGIWTGALANDNAGLFLGAQALAFGMGNAYSKADTQSMGSGAYFKWVEQERDYGNNKGVGVSGIFGIQANMFNSKRFGMIRIDTNDAMPS